MYQQSVTSSRVSFAPSSRRRFLGNLLAVSAFTLLETGCSRAFVGSMDPDIPVIDEDLSRLTYDITPPPGGCETLFPSFYLGGFEGSTHRRRDGTRLDLAAATSHDRFAEADYARLRAVGLTACRDGINWVVSEPRPGRFDFGRARMMLRAAERQRMQVAWDLLHFGWPDDIDLFTTAFTKRFVRYAAEFAKILRDETPASSPKIICPINEISFLSWAGGDEELFNPFEHERGFEMKCQLVRSTIEAMAAIRSILPEALFLHCDPIINVAPARLRPWKRRAAAHRHRLQYQTWDMIYGAMWPQLGGSSEFLDIVGVNYYYNNQHYLGGGFIDGTAADYRSLSEMLREVWHRYRKPILVSETGIEGDRRASWLRYIAHECGKAMREGCPILGVTWYPIVDHPGWVDDRYCDNGLWGYPDDAGNREIYAPLAEELQRTAAPLSLLRASALSVEGVCLRKAAH